MVRLTDIVGRLAERRVVGVGVPVDAEVPVDELAALLHRVLVAGDRALRPRHDARVELDLAQYQRRRQCRAKHAPLG